MGNECRSLVSGSIRSHPYYNVVILSGLQAVKDLAWSRYTASPCIGGDVRQILRDWSPLG